MSQLFNPTYRTLTVPNVSGLTNIVPRPADGQMVQTLGYYTPGDNGGNLYTYSASASGTVDWGLTMDGIGGDNSTATLQAAKTDAGSGSGRFLAVNQENFNVDKWGALNDGTTDNFYRIQSAIDAAASGGGGLISCSEGSVGSYDISDTLQISQRISINLSNNTIVQNTDNIPIIKVGSGSGSLAYMTIENTNLTYANFQPNSNTNALGILLADGTAISHDSAVRNCRISRCYQGVSLPTSSASAFLWEFTGLHIVDCSSYGFYFDGTGAGTNITLKNVYCQNASFTGDTASMRGFSIDGVKGISMNNCGMDGAASWPVFNFLSCHGTASNLFMENSTVNNPNTTAFIFSDAKMNIGSIFTFDTECTFDTGLAGTVRVVSVTDANVTIENMFDNDIVITDTSSDNYYSIFTDKQSTTVCRVENYIYNAINSNPNQGFAEFTNDQRLVTSVWAYDKNIRREKKGNRNHSYGTAAPTANTWAVGDIVWNTSPAAGGNIGWVCTTAGTPGTWKTFGSIEA